MPDKPKDYPVAYAYEQPLTEIWALRLTEKQKEIITTAGSADFWRKHIWQEARKILEEKDQFKLPGVMNNEGS